MSQLLLSFVVGPLTKVIRLKLFLGIAPISSADITRALRGCFRGGSVYVSFRFVLKQSKTSNSVKMFSSVMAISCFGSLSTLLYTSDLKWH